MVEVRFDIHPALLAALQGLADHRHCTLDQLLFRLINEGLTLELKISDLKVLEQTPQNLVSGSPKKWPSASH
jgi:hypothetical protein